MVMSMSEDFSERADDGKEPQRGKPVQIRDWMTEEELAQLISYIRSLTEDSGEVTAEAETAEADASGE